MSSLTADDARLRFSRARVARLATADGAGRPHLVPTVFAVSDDDVYTVVDAKPKRSTALRRLRNVEVNPRVALLVDHYTEDWDELWWARAEGVARIVDAAADEGRLAIRLLAERYRQHREHRPPGPVLAVRVVRWSGWSA